MFVCVCVGFRWKYVQFRNSRAGSSHCDGTNSCNTDGFEDLILMLLSVSTPRARKKSRVRVVRKQIESKCQILGVSVMKDPVSNAHFITHIHTLALWEVLLLLAGNYGKDKPAPD